MQIVITTKFLLKNNYTSLTATDWLKCYKFRHTSQHSFWCI